MTAEKRWHLTRPLLEGYVRGAARPAEAASIEAHLTSCARCRTMLDTSLPDPLVDRMWQQVVERIDAPQATQRRPTLSLLRTRRAESRSIASLRVRRVGFAVVAVSLTLVAADQVIPGGACRSNTDTVVGSSPSHAADNPVEITPVLGDGTHPRYVQSPGSTHRPGAAGVTGEPGQPDAGPRVPTAPGPSPTPGAAQRPEARSCGGQP